MEPHYYLPFGILGILFLSVLTMGINNVFLANPDASTTKIMVSVENSTNNSLFLAYKPTTEVYSPAGMMVNFTENKAGPTTINCTLSCQPMEGDTK